MSHFLRSFDTNECFWKQNPQVQVIDPFADFYKEDKSRGKKKSSQIMWAIFMLNDPTNANKLYRMKADIRKEQIVKNHFDDKDFKFDDYEYLSKAYLDLLITKKERRYAFIWKKWEEREDFILGLEYDMGTADFIDKLTANTEKILTTLVRAEEDMIKEQEGEELAGKARKSAIEGI